VTLLEGDRLDNKGKKKTGWNLLQITLLLTALARLVEALRDLIL
jgi:hypothetical protein